jgi:hypothetical protein
MQSTYFFSLYFMNIEVKYNAPWNNSQLLYHIKHVDKAMFFMA